MTIFVIWAVAARCLRIPPNSSREPLIGYTSALSEIENPNPMPSTNNFYTQDGYGGGSGSPTAVAPNANHGGGSYSNCSDATQPGVPAVLNYLNSLERKRAQHRRRAQREEDLLGLLWRSI